MTWRANQNQAHLLAAFWLFTPFSLHILHSLGLAWLGLTCKWRICTTSTPKLPLHSGFAKAFYSAGWNNNIERVSFGTWGELVTSAFSLWFAQTHTSATCPIWEKCPWRTDPAFGPFILQPVAKLAIWNVKFPVAENEACSSHQFRLKIHVSMSLHYPRTRTLPQLSCVLPADMFFPLVPVLSEKE